MPLKGAHRHLPRSDILPPDTHIGAMTQEATTAERPAYMPDSGGMADKAGQAASFLKTLGHEGRLMILCHLGDGEKTVSELEALLDMRQASVSQLLARLRDDGLVTARRNGKQVHYVLADHKTEQMIGLLYSLFCAPDV